MKKKSTEISTNTSSGAEKVENIEQEVKKEDEDINKLEELENKIVEADILNEEVRKALILLIVKAFKHCKMNLDNLTPDFICFIFALPIIIFVHVASIFFVLFTSIRCSL